MKIERHSVNYGFDGRYSYVHARGVILESGFGLITMQKLLLSGCDVFYGIEMVRSEDFGKSFSSPTPCENLKRRYFEDGTSSVMCDATPFYHKKTGRIILTGHLAHYGSDNKSLRKMRPRAPIYSVYNEKIGDFDPPRLIEMPFDECESYFSSGAGCTQIMELSSGDLLIPIYHKARALAEDPNAPSSVSVIKCAFDGERLTLLETGNHLTVTAPRGLGEPSIVYHGGKYLLALRNDESGYVSGSRDGLNFDTPTPLSFDDGEWLGNYNTQQHWLTVGDKLYLVYTRRAENNSHIFRHRAPLFIAEFDTDRMCVIRNSERIAVPERGARLGNFGCQSHLGGRGYIFVSEWMQNDPYGWEKCVERGSDNSIFIVEITP